VLIDRILDQHFVIGRIIIKLTDADEAEIDPSLARGAEIRANFARLESGGFPIPYQ
jgi:hypothetical protein